MENHVRVSILPFFSPLHLSSFNRSRQAAYISTHSLECNVFRWEKKGKFHEQSIAPYSENHLGITVEYSQVINEERVKGSVVVSRRIDLPVLKSTC